MTDDAHRPTDDFNEIARCPKQTARRIFPLDRRFVSRRFDSVKARGSQVKIWKWPAVKTKATYQQR
jgi:hypothetical protein